MTSDWSMPRHAETCRGCGRAFEVGEIFQAFLYETAGGYERRDFCLDCRPPAESAPIGSWKTRRPELAVKKVHPFDREAIYSFFERLEEAQGPQQVRFRFVLALLLWRKKVLKFERSVETGGRQFWEFLTPRTGAVHRIERPDLDEEHLEQLSVQLERLLAGETADGDVIASDFGVEEGHG